MKTGMILGSVAFASVLAFAVEGNFGSHSEGQLTEDFYQDQGEIYNLEEQRFNNSVKETETKVEASDNNCHPSYSGCLNKYASDYDCLGGSGNGPYYTGKVQVFGSDPFGLDRDNDGWGCD